MADHDWSFLNNSFISASNKSYPKFLSMSLFHFNVLKELAVGDPFITGLLAIYEPFHNQYKSTFNLWWAAQGTQKGTTSALYGLLQDLTGIYARKWDIGVQQEFDQDTDEYKMLFPHRRKPFMEGGQDERIAAVGTLSEQLKGFPTLSVVQADVEGYYGKLVGADSSKDGKIVATANLSDKLDELRIDAAWAMYGNLGAAMAEYKSDTKKIARLFPVTLVREVEQKDFLQHVLPSAGFSIVKRTMEPTEKITMKVTGPLPLTFFAGATKEQPSAELMFTVEPNQTLVKTAEEFGNSKATPFIHVRNSSAIAESEFELNLN